MRTSDERMKRIVPSGKSASGYTAHTPSDSESEYNSVSELSAGVVGIGTKSKSNVLNVVLNPH